MNTKKSNLYLLPKDKDMKKLEVLYNSKEFYKLKIEVNNLIEKYSNISTLHNILGLALQNLGDRNSAIVNFRKAIEINPKFFLAYNNLGNAFNDLGQYDDALFQYQQSIKIKPDYAQAYYNQGCVYRDTYKYNESIERYKQAIKIKPDYADAYTNLGYVLRHVGKLEEAIENYQKAINFKPNFIEAYSNIFFTLFYFTKDDPKYYLSQAKKFRSYLKPIDNNLLLKYQFNKTPKKLKIGFVSGDFKQHPVGFFLLDFLKHLKNKELELFAYSNSNQEDELSIKLKANFTNWYKIADQNDITVVNQIRKDGIHILIDLSGHSSKNRLPIFINKPAPIQMSWAGYPASTGIPEVDYLIGDSFVTPQNENLHFTEKIIRLPNIWVCFSAPDFDIKIRELPAIKNGYITFGSFNNLSKINDTVITLWSKILKSIPKSKIFLKTKELNNAYLKEKVMNKFKENGVNSNSIILEKGDSRIKLLDSYNKVDIALDPFPYSGGVTSFEAIWMGVPVLTKKGFKFVSHTTESINHNSGMSDWIANDKNNYINKAIMFSKSLKNLSEIRKNLRKKALASPSFNSNLFAEQFGNAVWKIWKKCNSKNSK